MLAEGIILPEQDDLPGVAPATRRIRSLLSTAPGGLGPSTHVRFAPLAPQPILRCGCGQQLGYAPFASLAEAGQVLRRTTTDTCASWNPWDPNYPHQGPMKETMTESNSSAQP
jgi:hypothetical protein